MQAAIVLTPGGFETTSGKVAHGLVRGSERFATLAVVDASCVGQDAGELLEGRKAGIPIVDSVESALEATEGVEVAIVGQAAPGGRLSSEMRDLLVDAARAGLSIVSGLHDFIAEDKEIAQIVTAHGATITDVRKPPHTSELHFWSGAIKTVNARRIAVLGTDCAIGKRTTSRLLTTALNESGVDTRMIYTGQTGWMQGGCHGIVLDSLPNDFANGEIEHAIVECDKTCSPDVMILEGQSGMRNPAGPSGPALVLSGGATHAVLVHAPARTTFFGLDDDSWQVPDVASEIALIEMYGVDVIGVSINTTDMTPEQVTNYGRKLRFEIGRPVVSPLDEGVGELVSAIDELVAEDAAA